MTMNEATRTCLRKAFAFDGRATRAEFWWFSGAVVLGFCAGLLLDWLLFPVAMMRGVLPLTTSVFVLTAIPMLSSGWRRMQDVGLPGHQLLLPLLAYLGFVAALWGGSAILFAILRQRVYDPWLYEAVNMFGAIIIPAGAAVGIFAGLLLLWWLAKPGQTGHNAYGPDPRQVTE
jgi:uncharacterized membrane protein YhaH (DUF805 family)